MKNGRRQMENKFYDSELEAKLLGSLLAELNPESKLNLIASTLKPEHFLFEEHKEVYRFLTETDQAINLTTVRIFCETTLPKSENLAKNLLSYAEGLCPYLDYAKILTEMWQKRQVRDVLESVSYGRSFSEIKSLIDEKIGDIAIESENESVSIQDAVRDVLEGAKSEIVKFNMPNLDNFLGGLEVGTLMVLGGRPSMGKTTMAVNMAYLASFRYSTLFFSLEVKNSNIARKVVSNLTSLKNTRLKERDFSKEEESALRNMNLSESRLRVDDSSYLTLGKIKAKIKREVIKRDLKVVFIDYLGFISTEKRGFNKHDEVTTVINGLKAIAKELNVVMVVLCQLNRGLEGRSNHRPILADLRESGSIEQTADIVAFVHREEYYLSKAKPFKLDEIEEWERDMAQLKGRSQLIIAKSRDNEIGDIEFNFDGRFSRFTELNNF